MRKPARGGGKDSAAVERDRCADAAVLREML